MLNREELKLLNEILEDVELTEKKKINLKKKLALICSQLDVMQKAQEEAGKIQEEIKELESDLNEEEK